MPGTALSVPRLTPHGTQPPHELSTTIVFIWRMRKLSLRGGGNHIQITLVGAWTVLQCGKDSLRLPEGRAAGGGCPPRLSKEVVLEKQVSESPSPTVYGGRFGGLDHCGSEQMPESLGSPFVLSTWGR